MLPGRIDLLHLVPKLAQQLGRVGDRPRADRVDHGVGDGRQRRGGDPQPAGAGCAALCANGSAGGGAQVASPGS